MTVVMLWQVNSSKVTVLLHFQVADHLLFHLVSILLGWSVSSKWSFLTQNTVQYRGMCVSMYGHT